MGKITKISWTGTPTADGIVPGATFNPWWGCTKVSPGCAHCYADAQAARYGVACFGAGVPRKQFGPRHWAEPLKWHAQAMKDGVRRKVFCGSMCDILDPEAPTPDRERLWALVAQTPGLDWLLLTKRPEYSEDFFPSEWWHDGLPANVWMGVTAENQDRWDTCVQMLAAMPAVVRFVSIEPMLGPIDLRGISVVDWLIFGGESGPGARPMEEAWVRDGVRQCAAAGVACYVKQAGNVLARQWGCSDGKGDIIGEFPPDLRIQQYPFR